MAATGAATSVPTPGRTGGGRQDREPKACAAFPWRRPEPGLWAGPAAWGHRLGPRTASTVDVHRRKTTLVVMRIPERELLCAMCCTEGVVDIEDLQLARLHRRAELIEQSRGEPRRLGLARRILQTADGRLRGQRLTALRTAAHREFHQRIVPQPVEVDCISRAAARWAGRDQA